MELVKEIMGMRKMMACLVVIAIYALIMYTSVKVNAGTVFVLVVLPWVGLLIAWRVGKAILSAKLMQETIGGIVPWAKRHTNWAWSILYIVVLLLAFSMVEVVIGLPHVMSSYIVEEPISLHYQNGTQVMGATIHRGVTEVDVEATDNRRLIECALWFWPIYWIGSYKATKWALDTKNVSIYGVWILALVFPIIALFVKNKESVK